MTDSLITLYNLFAYKLQRCASFRSAPHNLPVGLTLYTMFPVKHSSQQLTDKK